MSEDDYGSEGEKNLREQMKTLLAEKKEAQARLEALEAEREVANAAARQAQLEAVFSEAGLPSKLAKVYPADAVTDVASVKAWAVDEIGFVPQAPEVENDSPFSRYDSLVRNAYARGASNDEVADLLARAQKGAKEALGPLNRRNVYQPTAEERKDAMDVTDKINELHREAEQMVDMGRLSAMQHGYGGRFDPPSYADRTREAR